MDSMGLKPFDEDDSRQGKAILEGFVADDKAEAAEKK
jgi:hypothetical protein